MRVIQTSRSGKPKRPSLRNTFQKKVDRSRNNNDSKGSHNKRVISAFFLMEPPVKNLMDKFFLIHFFVQLIFFSIFVVWKTNIKQDTHLKIKTSSL